MLFLALILLISVFVILIILIASAKNEIYRQSPIFSQSTGKIKIGPLEYDLMNRSTLTYKDLGYLGNTGNQLFQIASVLAIAYRNKCKVVFPTIIKELSIYQMFDISCFPIEDIKYDAQILEFDNYEEINIPNDGRVYSLEGYRQSYLYLEPIRGYLKYLFPVKCDSPSNGNYIAIHIRRTDYINVSCIHKILQLQLNCSLDYYQAAIQRIRKENNLPLTTPVIVVTDDPKWARSQLEKIDPYAKLNLEQSKNGDFFCMYFARYLVITNSTFSLWAAFLGDHERIIAPSYWWPSNSMTSHVVQINRQLICLPSWSFNHPITGEIIKESYNWGPEYWSTPNCFNRTMRAIFATNIFRKKT
jgi:hypothetical protein